MTLMRLLRLEGPRLLPGHSVGQFDFAPCCVSTQGLQVSSGGACFLHPRVTELCRNSPVCLHSVHALGMLGPSAPLPEAGLASQHGLPPRRVQLCSLMCTGAEPTPAPRDTRRSSLSEMARPWLLAMACVAALRNLYFPAGSRTASSCC